jgi:hypothetical protein
MLHCREDLHNGFVAPKSNLDHPGGEPLENYHCMTPLTLSERLCYHNGVDPVERAVSGALPHTTELFNGG